MQIKYIHQPHQEKAISPFVDFSLGQTYFMLETL